MDELDKKILRVMQKDCRRSFREISKEVGATPVTVINRVRNMEKAGILKGYCADINYEKLGYGITAIIGVIAEGAGLKRLEEDVSKFDNIKLVYEVTGDTDVVLIGAFRDMKEMQSFVKERLLAKNFVTKTITQVVTNVYKDSPKIDIK
ncbi:MAG: Lrp/AsnC family transcriptional regulator [Candidatus Aenigmatarchaeota archaeon]|nr:MAG: Lrp/AsnC family transcriptional regulator [Candidatus Aenigmarchaeota archaeon]